MRCKNHLLVESAFSVFSINLLFTTERLDAKLALKFDEILRGHRQRVPIKEALLTCRQSVRRDGGESGIHLIRAVSMTEH